MTPDNNVSNQVPKWFTVIAIIALLWNLMGLLAFVSHVMMTPEMISHLPLEEQALYQNSQAWSTVAFAIAVIAGTLGSLLLVLKKSFAKPVLILSLFGVLAQNVHSFFVIDSMAVYGVTSVIMPMVVILIGILLILLCNRANENQWLS